MSQSTMSYAVLIQTQWEATGESSLCTVQRAVDEPEYNELCCTYTDAVGGHRREQSQYSTEGSLESTNVIFPSLQRV